MRFAIHVEPILFPISLLYLFWPDPRTLIILQTIVVALGAFPAFWLARLRLRNEIVSVGIAVLYLLLPAQLAGTIYDFHAVTLTASFLLFALYFLYTRRTLWFFIFAILAMACKEEVALLVIGLGLWSIIFQQRWRSGLAVTAIAAIWAWVALIVLPHLFSPVGHALLASRYTALGASPEDIIKTMLFHPLTTLKEYVFEPGRLAYLLALFGGSGILSLLSPWTLVLSIPTIAVNLFSTNDQMHSAVIFYQYNVEIVPVLIFATIEAIVLISRLVKKISRRFARTEPMELHLRRNFTLYLPSTGSITHYVFLTLCVCGLLCAALIGDSGQDHMPFTQYAPWPRVTPHTQLAQQFIEQIPAKAAVSAQSKLVDHISHRPEIYLFPYGDGVTTPAYADYIFLDEDNGDIYPYDNDNDMRNEVNRVLQSGIYGILSNEDGYILLKRGLTSTDGTLPGPVPPDAFSGNFHDTPIDPGQPLAAPQSFVPLLRSPDRTLVRELS